jgi:hypothetical protein
METKMAGERMTNPKRTADSAVGEQKRIRSLSFIL